MMVVLGQALGEFVPGELVVGDDAGDDAGLFEHDQVAVHARLGETVAGFEDLRDGDGLPDGAEGSHQGTPTLGVALIRPPEEGVDLVVEFVAGHG